MGFQTRAWQLKGLKNFKDGQRRAQGNLVYPVLGLGDAREGRVWDDSHMLGSGAWFDNGAISLAEEQEEPVHMFSSGCMCGI